MAMMKNRIPLILLLNIAGVALFCSWYLPANHGAWLPVDSAIFHFFNHGVSVSHAYAWLLAIINNRAFDACSLLAMGCLMLSYWLKAPTAGRRQIAIMGLVMLLIFASFMWRYFGRRALGVALIIFVVFAFPRVMIGAHWFSDIAVGSLTAVLIGAPWVLMTPLSDKLIAFFDRYLPSRISAK
ncbi:TPA: hypothetical protein ACNICY_002118 [Klebsiella pneumoniae]|uniref:hypothetical protein n=1 Tax=Klebsiella pneumoniae TaxID=573 RepID=UPI00200D8F3C|nr:hypothetical protein [Klebsiella pneumoniae]EKU2908470.1 hypothetical protein [Klebsiella pneumoniae]EKZ6870425.1 hypothetical protein [Klebsiella pneumoniae]ELA0564740.1 hypothetical protein [Klebsiella pneumoniae]ELA1698640.1 hypothetical protein [Klebsiella pneumoniae]ELA1703784.1 hypothetical protein [Klebsiella pneumoniae]